MSNFFTFHCVSVVKCETTCTCRRDLFPCEQTNRGECTCIPPHWVCDGDIDCEKGNDEIGCGE